MLLLVSDVRACSLGEAADVGHEGLLQFLPCCATGPSGYIDLPAYVLLWQLGEERLTLLRQTARGKNPFYDGSYFYKKAGIISLSTTR